MNIRHQKAEYIFNINNHFYPKDEPPFGSGEHSRLPAFTALGSFYERENGWMKVVPWDEDVIFHSEDIYVGLDVQTLDSTGRFTKGEPKKIKHLFQPLPGEKTLPRKVLVRADPGLGKSVMCCKIAHDWARELEVFPGFPPSKTLVVHYRLRALGDEAILEDELIKLILLNNQKSIEDETIVSDLKEIILGLKRLVIVVLDGLDEVSQNHKEQVKELLMSKPGSAFIEASILVTSRPEVDKAVLKLFHKHFILKDMSKKSAVKLIKKYFQESDEFARSFYRSSVMPLHSERLSPLLVIMICYCKGKEGLDVNVSTVQLYRKLVFLIVKHSIEKQNLNLEDSAITEKLNKLSKYFCICLKGKKTVFKEDEILDSLKEDFEFAKFSGLIKKMNRNTWEPVHLMLVETVATRYLENEFSRRSRTGELSSFLLNNFTKIRNLNVYCYTELDGNDVFRIDFHYRRFRFSCEICGAEKKFQVFNISLLEDLRINEHYMSISLKTSLTDSNSEIVMNTLKYVFPNSPALGYLSSILNTYLFENLSLLISPDCEAKNSDCLMKMMKSSGQSSVDKQHPLCLLRSSCKELCLTFLKASCSVEIVSSVLSNILGSDINVSCLESPLDVLKHLQYLSITPKLVSGQVQCEKAFAKASSTEITIQDESWFFLKWFQTPDFTWQKCDRIELFFKVESLFESEIFQRSV